MKHLSARRGLMILAVAVIMLFAMVMMGACSHARPCVHSHTHTSTDYKKVGKRMVPQRHTYTVCDQYK